MSTTLDPASHKTAFVLLNGPPGAGKTTLGRLLVSRLSVFFDPKRVYSDSMASPMKHFIATALGAKYQNMPKEQPVPELANRSVREFLIDLSENYIKPNYGLDTFGRWLNYRALRYPDKPYVVIVDDAGFEPEVAVLEKRILIHVKRVGHTFDKDSRSYLPDPDWIIHNNSTIEEFQRNAFILADEIADFLWTARYQQD